ncbi:MAG: bifunctional aconitate hydratase 2/2-methylisocitrate dehydratase [Deltaproteobacteria bacterium]|nr:bifunctional aconitate hydratase 2/2-methylisocitrate dehydratase [Deltaproteobacteria bacterium]
MIKEYLKHEDDRKKMGIPPLPLSEAQAEALVELLANPEGADPDFLMDLLANRIPAGVDPAARVKAEFLTSIVRKRISSPFVTPGDAVRLLSTMRGGFNVGPLIGLLEDETLGRDASNALESIILIFDAFDTILTLSEKNLHAKSVIESWAAAKWFTRAPAMAKKITVTIFKVDGETNTDDLSPASEAWSRPDIPLHSLSMLAKRVKKPLETIATLKKNGYPVAFAGDVVGTGSSRKSASNSLIWHIGDDIPHIPNKRRGGIVLGAKIAPIFFNSLEDAGALPIECDVSDLKTGDVIDIYPYEGRIEKNGTGETMAEFALKTEALADEVRAGGRIALIIGRTLTATARKALCLPGSDMFARPAMPEKKAPGFTLAQKIVGRACGKGGVLPGEYCEPKMTTVGSQDTTGPMTKDELAELACLKFSADLVLQTFCHTAPYPRRVDIKMHEDLHEFMKEREGLALLPGDGIIHSWMNRMLIPDTVGTGGDSHTRFPLGISFPAGSGLVAFAAAIGTMPLDMPESVLVRFSGRTRPGITLRDVVNAIPLAAIDQGLLTVEKAGKKNVFSGRILEMEGLSDLPVEHAFELSNASAERSAAAATIALSPDKVKKFINESIVILTDLLEKGYGDAETINRRISAMKAWLAEPELLVRDKNAEFAAIIDINLNEITEPILACPNDPDDVRRLSDVAGTAVDEVFIGSCMTSMDRYIGAANILNNKGRTRARLWITPATRMDAVSLRKNGYYNLFCRAGARIEMPGCSLCMGNQARVSTGATVVSTSTRNFPNRMGDDTNVFLASAEVAAVTALLGRIPTMEEYMEFVNP